MIHIKALTKHIAGAVVLDDISLDVARGEVVALIGPSGTGKSVMLKHIVGLMQPDSGDVLIDDRSIVHARRAELSRLRRLMGYVFQDAALLDSLTVEENLRLALNDSTCIDQPEICTGLIEDALAAVNLDRSILSRLPGQLSGGMRKRVGVARALVNHPEIMLYDEPATGLDPQNISVITHAIIASRARRATNIVVTHDIVSIPQYADRVILLKAGRIQFDGTPEELFSTRDSVVRGFTATAALRGELA